MLQPEINQNQTQLEHSKLTLTFYLQVVVQHLEKVLFQSKVLGASIVFLEVRVSNHKAINFYEKFGFKRDAIRYNYYDGNPKEDALLMSKQGL